MAYREVHGVEIREVIRRWQDGFSQRRIASGTGVARVTVRRYIKAAEATGLEPGGAEPSEEQLAALATLSVTRPRQAATPIAEVLEPWSEQIHDWLTTDRLQVTRVQELLAERGCEVSYTSLRRFIGRRGWGEGNPGRCGWRTDRRARWRRWTSDTSAWSPIPRRGAGARCGR